MTGGEWAGGAHDWWGVGQGELMGGEYSRLVGRAHGR